MAEETTKPTPEETSGTKRQVFGAHLRALRSVVFICVGTVLVAFFIIFYLFNKPLIDFILQPVTARGIPVIATRVSESLMMQVKTCLVAAAVVSMPVIIWQVGSFVWPALYPKEKLTFSTTFAALVLMFAVGIVFAYLTVFPLAIELFYEAGAGVATTMWSVEGYFNFVLSFVLPFGLMFELPVVIYLLARAGKVSAASLATARKYFILGAAVVAAVLTPPDVVSQTLLLLPLLALYEISVLIARFVKSREAQVEA